MILGYYLDIRRRKIPSLLYVENIALLSMNSVGISDLPIFIIFASNRAVRNTIKESAQMTPAIVYFSTNSPYDGPSYAILALYFSYPRPRSGPRWRISRG